jgi:hypothetical protein
MIIWKSKENRQIRGRARTNVLGYRWVFEVSTKLVGISHQYLGSISKEWHYAQRYYSLNFTRKFLLGRSHAYYDGPHDRYSLGFLHVNWSDKWCQQCYEAA